ncbi:MAG: hypothetical protein WCO63_11350 [Bacteroidota bacterium]
MKTNNKLISINLLLILLLSLFSLQTNLAQNLSKTAVPALKETNTKQEAKKQDNGKLVPRVALTGANDNTSIKGTSTNLLIYNTAKAGLGSNEVYPGYYHNMGTSEKPSWKRIEVTVSEAVKNKQ